MQEFEDHFDDEIDFTPPAEDTPSMQSPAEVYTLAVSPVALPGPPHLQPPGRITGRTHALSETLGQRPFVITTVSVVTLILPFDWFDRRISRVSGRTPQPELHSRNWQWLVRTGIVHIQYTSLLFLDGPVVTPARAFSVCVITGYFE